MKRSLFIIVILILTISLFLGCHDDSPSAPEGINIEGEYIGKQKIILNPQCGNCFEVYEQEWEMFINATRFYYDNIGEMPSNFDCCGSVPYEVLDSIIKFGRTRSCLCIHDERFDPVGEFEFTRAKIDSLTDSIYLYQYKITNDWTVQSEFWIKTKIEEGD